MESFTTEELIQKTSLSTFVEGFMEECKDEKKINLESWKAALESDINIRRLAVGAVILTEIREAVLKETGFTCSAGIAHNKVCWQ